MSKTIQEIPIITSETTIANAKNWLNIVRFGESGTVTQLQDDSVFRVLDIINNRKILRTVLGPYFQKYIFIYIQIDEKDLNQTIKNALIQACNERKIRLSRSLTKLSNREILSTVSFSGYDVGLFISHIAPLLNNDNYQPLIDLEFLVRTNKNLSVIAFSEIDITSEKFKTLANRVSFLFDNIIRYPLYAEQDCRQFIKYYCHQWKASLSEKVIKEIIRTCGGYLWLIHQAMRNMRDYRNVSARESLTSELMITKLESIWSKFSDQEKRILRKIIFGSLQKTDTLSHEYKYLLDLRVIKETKNEVKLGIPLFSLVAEKENKLNEVQTKDSRILIGEKDITSHLSTKEKLIVELLLNHKKKIIHRDKIAQVLWGKDWEEKYSDWAIDRLIHRIRIKLHTLCIDEKLLKTVKKKGFVFG